MTGFGAGAAALADARIALEIRSVNHRYLDVHVHVPAELPELASHVEALARDQLGRGRFEIGVRIETGGLAAVTLDRARARSIYAELVALRDELAPAADVPLSLLASVPELFVPTVGRDGEALRGAALEAFAAARTALDAMRVREGAMLRSDLVARLATLLRITATLVARAPLVVEAYRRRLAERAAQLRTGLDVDAGRLEQEVAIFADRCDVAEELTRLEAHCRHFDLLLAEDVVGRRLDFLLQEMGREVNTIGAKSQDVAIAHAVVELKAEIERMREQVQNVE